MGFYFCGRYINIDAEDKEVERDMYATLPYFQGSNDHDGYEKWENHLEDFFSYFFLTPEQNCRYAQLKLAGESYWWWEDSHINCRDWLVLQDLRTRYASHVESSQFNDLVTECKEIFTDMVKILERKVVEVIESSKPEPKVDDKATLRP